MTKGEIKKLTDENFKEEIAKGITLVDFHADWCGPCRMLAPVLEKVASEVKGSATVAKVDIDHSQEAATLFQVTSVPTLVLFKDGEEVNRMVGLRDGEAIKEMINSAQK